MEQRQSGASNNSITNQAGTSNIDKYYIFALSSTNVTNSTSSPNYGK